MLSDLLYAFTAADSANGPRVVIINEALAGRFVPAYPRQSAVGLRVPMIPMESRSNERLPFTIAGVVADFRGSRLDAPVDPQIFLPAGIALVKPQTPAERLDASIAPRRFEMTLLTRS